MEQKANRYLETEPVGVLMLRRSTFEQVFRSICFVLFFLGGIRGRFDYGARPHP